VVGGRRSGPVIGILDEDHRLQGKEGRGGREQPRQGTRCSIRVPLSVPFTRSGCKRPGTNCAYYCQLQWCLVPGCKDAFLACCSHRRKSDGGNLFEASSERPPPPLFCPLCIHAVMRKQRWQQGHFSKVDQNVWEKLWKLSVMIQPLGSNNASKDGIVEHLDVLRAKLSDLVNIVKYHYPSMHRLLTIKGGEDEILWEAIRGNDFADEKLDDVLGDEQTVYVDLGGNQHPRPHPQPQLRSQEEELEEKEQQQREGAVYRPDCGGHQRGIQIQRGLVEEGLAGGAGRAGEPRRGGHRGAGGGGEHAEAGGRKNRPRSRKQSFYGPGPDADSFSSPCTNSISDITCKTFDAGDLRQSDPNGAHISNTLATH